MTVSLDYLAGIIDIKGGFYVKRIVSRSKCNGTTVRYSIQLTVSTTHKPIVLALHEVFGGSVSNKGNESARSRMCWEWKVSDRRARDTAQRILPKVVARLAQVGFFADFPFADNGGRLTPEQKLAAHKTWVRIKRLNVPCFRKAICGSE